MALHDRTTSDLHGISTMNSSYCLLTFLILFLASVSMQFVRAKKRQRLVRQCDHAWLSATDLEKWNSINASLDLMFKDFRKLQIIKKNRQQFPRAYSNELDRYKLLSRLEAVVTVSMLLFAAFAIYVCK